MSPPRSEHHLGHERERGQPSFEYSSSGVPAQDVAHLMASIARQLDTEQGEDATLHALVAAAVDAIPGADSAGITFVHKHGLKLDVRYASDRLVVDLDTIQYEVAEGPCLHSAYQHRTVRIEDFATEQRWPAFTARARDLGAGCELALQLYVHNDDMAALNVYSRQARPSATSPSRSGCCSPLTPRSRWPPPDASSSCGSRSTVETSSGRPKAS
jgi:hypothetical protein